MEAWRKSDPGALPWLAHKPRQSWDSVATTQARGNSWGQLIVKDLVKFD